jgi:glycerol kinase
LGAAYLAGLAVGYWKSINDIQQQWQADKIFSPKMENEKRNKLLSGWHKAVNAVIFWSK